MLRSLPSIFFLILASLVASPTHALVGAHCHGFLVEASIHEAHRASVHTAIDEAVVSFFDRNGITIGDQRNLFIYTEEKIQPHADQVYEAFVKFAASKFSGADLDNFFVKFAACPLELRRVILAKLFDISTDHNSKTREFPHEIRPRADFDLAQDFAAINRTPNELLDFQAGFLRLPKNRGLADYLRDLEWSKASPYFGHPYDPREDVKFARAALYVIRHFASDAPESYAAAGSTRDQNYYIFALRDGRSFDGSFSSRPFRLDDAIEVLSFYNRHDDGPLNDEIFTALDRIAVDHDPAARADHATMGVDALVDESGPYRIQFNLELALLRRGIFQRRSVDFVANVFRELAAAKREFFLFYDIIARDLNPFQPLHAIPGGEPLIAALRDFLIACPHIQDMIAPKLRHFREDVQSGSRDMYLRVGPGRLAFLQYQAALIAELGISAAPDTPLSLGDGADLFLPHPH